MKLVWEGEVTLDDGSAGGRFTTFTVPPEAYYGTGGGRYFVVRVEWWTAGAGAGHADSKWDIEQTASLRDDGLGWSSLFKAPPATFDRRLTRGASFKTFVVTGIATADLEDVQSLWRFVIRNGSPLAGEMLAIRYRVWITPKDA